jgi:hypothetical protein
MNQKEAETSAENHLFNVQIEIAVIAQHRQDWEAVSSVVKALVEDTKEHEGRRWKGLKVYANFCP